VDLYRDDGQYKDAIFTWGMRTMPFGMEAEEIESKVVDELSKRRGHVLRFNSYQIEIIARAIASVIVENNARIQDSLSESGVDFK